MDFSRIVFLCRRRDASLRYHEQKSKKDEERKEKLRGISDVAFFSRGHATLHLAVSVRPSVGLSVHPSIHKIPELRAVFSVSAPAQHSATVVPCTRTCFGCVHTSLKLGMLVGWLVGPSFGRLVGLASSIGRFTYNTCFKIIVKA